MYAEPLCRRHYDGWLGPATLLRVSLLLLSIGVSLVMAFATGGFWTKTKPTLSQPRVTYTQEALLIFEARVDPVEVLQPGACPAPPPPFLHNMAAGVALSGDAVL